ncbi:MAG TPA: FAD-binding oxidoreductase [Candidatus Limnocylindrales bacterium]|nr:FAD-binding oxidoreductase [Candidatus Limnocylindrales bacterium]
MPEERLRTADAVVVVGGIMGLSTAWHLAERGLSTVLFEREASVGLGSTGRCAGGFRHQFSSEVNVRLSLESVRMIREFSATHGLPLDVHVDGYLFLVRDEASWAAYRAGAEMQRRVGARVELLDAGAAGDLVPGLVVDGVVGATFGPDDGIADPSGLVNGYATLARRAGAGLRTGTSVSAIRTSRDGSRVVGIETDDGSIDAPIVVLAAGVWAPALAATCGVSLPVTPEPRQLVVTTPFPGRPGRRTLVIDTANMFFFHREGDGLLMSVTPREPRVSFDTANDDRFVADELLPYAIGLLPALERAALAHTWTGLYEMSPDRDAILGPVEGLAGLLLAAGFSGHGFQHGPIVGKILAEFATGVTPTLDVRPLRLERFAAGQALVETHVV